MTFFGLMLLVFVFPSLVIAQSDDQVELLRQQVEFLRDTNSQALTSYQMTLQYIQTYVTWVVGGSAVIGLGVIAGTIYQLRQMIKGMVETQVAKEVAKRIDEEVGLLKQVIRREHVVGESRLAYLRPPDSTRVDPNEVQLLRDRQFLSVEYIDRVDNIHGHQVIVLDLMGTEPSEEVIEEWLNRTKHKLNKHQVLIVYIAGRYEAVDKMRKQFRNTFGVANMPLSLISTCVDAAHIAYSLERAS